MSGPTNEADLLAAHKRAEARKVAEVNLPRQQIIKIGDVYKLTNEELHNYLKRCRWPETDGEPVCPKCGRSDYYDLKSRPVWKCRSCYHQFSVTSGTLFSSRKQSFQELVLTAFLFAGAAKGISSGQMARMLGVDQKTAFYLAHKFRHALLNETDSLTLSGEIEIDGAVFGGHRRHANIVLDGKRKRFTKLMTEHKRVVIIARQRGGRSVPFVGRRESDAVRDISRVIQPGSILYADEARSWDKLSRLFGMLRIKHKSAFSFEGACTNNAESYFSQLRKLHSGTHHKISGQLLRAYACELAWRLDHSKLSQAARTEQLLHIALQPTEQRVLWRDRLTEEDRPSAEIIRLHPRSPASLSLPLSPSDHERLPMVIHFGAKNEPV